jgi:hypothetical protein
LHADCSGVVPTELARPQTIVRAMDDRSELVAAGVLALYLFLVLAVGDWLLLVPSVAGLVLAGWFRLRGTTRDSGYDRA